MSFLTKFAADLALTLKQPIGAFCDLHTADADAILTDRGEFVTVIRILGVRRILSSDPRPDAAGNMRASDVDQHCAGLALELKGLLEKPGHAQQWWFASDPALAGPAIRRDMSAAGAVADQIGMDIRPILAERDRRWSKMMRWEANYLALWTRRGVLTPEEAKQMTAEHREGGKGFPRIGDAQDPFLATEVLRSHHGAYVDRVLAALRHQGVGTAVIRPAEMASAVRESVLPETIGQDWRPRLIGEPMWPREVPPDAIDTAESLLPPVLRDQMLTEDAEELTRSTVRIGDYDWAGVDMALGPEQARPFGELVARLADARIPWRVSMLIDGGGASIFALKSVVATVLGFGANRGIWEGFEANDELRKKNLDATVRLRVSFATWAPNGHPRVLRRQRAILQHRVHSWGNLQTNHIAGDPLAAVMSSALAVAPASTANSHQAPLLQALRMATWNRPGWFCRGGPVAFRTPDGAMVPYDPVSPARHKVTDLISGGSRRGKSVLANTINLGLCLSAAALGPNGARLPLIGKIDIGRSAQGLVKLVQEALPDGRKDEAIYVPLRFEPEFGTNFLDTQVCCQKPLQLEAEFQRNFLAHLTTPVAAPGDARGGPPEGMAQLIPVVLDEAFRMFGTEGANTRPKPYQPGMNAQVDKAIAEARLDLRPGVYWWEVVHAFAQSGEWRMAEMAQRYAVPILEDLIVAARADRVRQNFDHVVPHHKETLLEMFTRYIKAAIKKYPTINMPTRLDFGQARLIVIDLDAVAPTSSDDADHQTGLVYMLARHLIGRNFFVRPEYAEAAPSIAREHLRRRFAETYETVKRLDYDEFQRTKNQPTVRAMVERDEREGGKHNVQLACSSQRMPDFGDHLLTMATGRFICGVGDNDEAEELGRKLRLAESTVEILRHRLNGPDPKGAGAPFLAVMLADDIVWEQMLVNSLGPIELWALSTTPEDAALRDRLYDRVGFKEALRRLAAVFPAGTAAHEIHRRKDARMRRGEENAKAETGVVNELAAEIIDGRGLGVVVRDPGPGA